MNNDKRNLSLVFFQLFNNIFLLQVPSRRLQHKNHQWVVHLLHTLIVVRISGRVEIAIFAPAF